MRKNSKKILLTLLIVMTSTFIGINSYAHSGRTDSSGGHKDNKNKSGLGSYHYHCGGHPAHLHTNGVCPYSTSSSSNKSNTSSSSSSKSSSSSSSTSTTSSNTKSTVPATIEATGIRINEDIKSMNIGESKNLTATITPNDTTNKSIEWKSSDESIVIVSETGKITAKKAGVVDITASTSNGKTNTIKVTVNEEEKVNSSNIISTSAIVSSGINNDNTNNDNTNNKSESSNPIGGIATVGLLGGGSYLGYKKYKKSK